jgi:hypothetical protein
LRAVEQEMLLPYSPAAAAEQVEFVQLLLQLVVVDLLKLLYLWH